MLKRAVLLLVVVALAIAIFAFTSVNSGTLEVDLLFGKVNTSVTVAFVVASTGDPTDWTTRYLGERIERCELFLYRRNDRIAAIGECRIDQRSSGHAHLGVIVGPSHRGRGLATSLLIELVGIAGRSGLAPLCSTEPGNVAARHAIHRAGFRSGHRVFRLAFTRGHRASTRSTR